MKYDNPLLVRWEYASEERLQNRNAILRSLSTGTNPEQAAFDAVADLKPTRILDVLTKGGRLVAASVCDDNLDEVWARDIESELMFPNTDALRTFAASTIDSAHLAPQVPEITEPFRATTRHVVFVASAPLH